MSYNAQAGRYLEAEVMSRSREWLVPLLYDHLLSGLNRAAYQIEHRDIEGKAASLERAVAILFELTSSLDLERGGELARHLSSLYSFFVNELITAGRTLEIDRLTRLIPMITDLREAWVEAADSIAPRQRVTALAGAATA